MQPSVKEEPSFPRIGGQCRIIENDSGLHFLLEFNTKLSDYMIEDMLLKNEIPNNGVYLYQPCFRLQNIHDPFYNGTKIKYPGYFNMLATLVPAQSIVKLQQIIVDIMDQQGIARNRIKLNTTKKEPLLIKDLQCLIMGIVI